MIDTFHDTFPLEQLEDEGYRAMARKLRSATLNECLYVLGPWMKLPAPSRKLSSSHMPSTPIANRSAWCPADHLHSPSTHPVLRCMRSRSVLPGF